MERLLSNSFWICLLAQLVSCNHMPWSSRVGKLSDPVLSFDPFAMPPSSSSASSQAASSATGISSSASSSARSSPFRLRSIGSSPIRSILARGRLGQRGSGGVNYIVAVRRGSGSSARPRNSINNNQRVALLPARGSRLGSGLSSIPAIPLSSAPRSSATISNRPPLAITRGDLLRILGIADSGSTRLTSRRARPTSGLPSGVVFLRDRLSHKVQPSPSAPIILSGPLPVVNNGASRPLLTSHISNIPGNTAQAASVASASAGANAAPVPAAVVPSVINIGGGKTATIANSAHQFTIQSHPLTGGITLTGPGGTVTIGAEILNGIAIAGSGPIKHTEFEEVEAEEPMLRNQDKGLKVSGNNGQSLILAGKTQIEPVRSAAGSSVVISNGASGNIIVANNVAAASSSSASAGAGASAASSAASSNAGGASVEVVSSKSSTNGASTSASATGSASGGNSGSAIVTKNTGKGHVIRLGANQKTVTIGSSGSTIEVAGSGSGIKIPGNATFIVEG